MVARRCRTTSQCWVSDRQLRSRRNENGVAAGRARMGELSVERLPRCRRMRDGRGSGRHPATRRCGTRRVTVHRQPRKHPPRRDAATGPAPEKVKIMVETHASKHIAPLIRKRSTAFTSSQTSTTIRLLAVVSYGTYNG